MGPYVASKAALIASPSRCRWSCGAWHQRQLRLAIDHRHGGHRAAMPDADPRQWVAADDLAAVICFLASADARAIPARQSGGRSELIRRW